MTPRPQPSVVRLATPATLPLRRSVLRTGTASADPTFPQDDDPATIHLGVEIDGRLIAVSTWTPEPLPTEPSVPALRLRGMAVDPAVQGGGYGGMLIAAGCARADDLGVTRIWANARDTALGFYERHGFAVVEPGFADVTTGLAHHVIVLDR